MRMSFSTTASLSVVCLVGHLAVAAERETQSLTRMEYPSVAQDEPRQSISLDGRWAFALDPKNIGEKENWSTRGTTLSGTIRVPGCWQAQGIGDPKGCLRHHYEGPAWYARSVPIPASWKGKTFWLKIGGASRRAKAFVNGKMVGAHDGFLTPFRFDITDTVKPGGENSIAIRVDNSGGGPVGYVNYIGNWGGIYRSVEIEAANATWLEDIFVIPDVDRNQAKVRITLGTREQIPPARMTLKVRVSPLVGKEAFVETKDIEVKRPFHEMETEVVVAMSDVKLWFPETPHLYAAEVTLANEHGVCDSRQVRFGMRKIDWSGGLKLNGRPHLLRACGDNVADVITGLPPASKDFFAKRLMPIKAFGFNTIRFHSHVPPEECFQAADEAGVFIQGELPVVYFNRFLPNKELLRRELVRILRCYRNHPSFFSLAMGNEFSINVVHFTDREKQEFQDAIREFYDLAKRLDPTRPILSNEGEPRLLPTDIHTLYSDVFYGEPIGGRPFVLHEYGSYRGSLPDIASRDKFTGVCAPYKGVIEQAKWVEDHSLQGIYPTILKNSQLLLEIGRKDLLEAARRNPNIDGFSYWFLTDFPGGVEGDVWHYGILDQFRQPKQATPESMRPINSPTVLLLDAEMADRCIWADEGKAFPILVSHYGARPIRNGILSWRLMLDGKTLICKTRSGVTANVGEVKPIATANLGVLPLDKGELLELAIELKEANGTYANSWPVWAFPHAFHQRPKAIVACQRQLAGELAAYGFIRPFHPNVRPDVLIASQIDKWTQKYVADGGKLMLFPKRNSLVGQCDFPLFNNSFATICGNGAGTIIRRGGVMDRFPHRGFCEEQFVSLMQTGTAWDIDGGVPNVADLWGWKLGGREHATAPFTPEIWGIKPSPQETGVVRLTREAMLFTARLGKGEILVCTLDMLKALNEKRPEADWLFHVLLESVLSGASAKEYP